MLTIAAMGGAAFAPSSAPQRMVRAQRAAPVMVEGILAHTVQYALALPTMYALMSANEYMTHRYFQHLEFNRPDTMVGFKNLIMQATGSEEAPTLPGDGHVEHHAETYDDMSLKNDARWQRTPASQSLDEDPFRGTAFHWHATGIMTIQMLPSVLPTYALMGWSVPETLALLMPCMLVHAAVWNAIHPPMHGLPMVPANVGVPSHLLAEKLRDTAYFKYIFENHMGHHVLGGQCNYNVCCPLTDHLLGTYVKTSEWKKRMRAIPEHAETRGAVVAFDGVPAPPSWAEAKAARAGTTVEKLAGGGARIADAYSS